jgi:hypothetical protein
LSAVGVLKSFAVTFWDTKFEGIPYYA